MVAYIIGAALGGFFAYLITGNAVASIFSAFVVVAVCGVASERKR